MPGTSKKFNDNKITMGLDKFGYPATHIANDLLTGIEDLGAEAKQLESSWYEWLHYNPFDHNVSARLTELLTDRIAHLDPEKDADRIQQLEKKINAHPKPGCTIWDPLSGGNRCTPYEQFSKLKCSTLNFDCQLVQGVCRFSFKRVGLA